MLLTATRLDAPPPQVLDGLDHAIETAEEALLRTQRPDGHFVFELEADVSIPCEYILFMAFRGLPMDAYQSKLNAYLGAPGRLPARNPTKTCCPVAAC